MLIRIVRMTFKEDSVDDFLEIFRENSDQIKACNGCVDLELLRDLDNPNVFITKSRWINQSLLEDYRNSEFFKTTWQKTKPLFSEKPLAFSSEKYL
ncbi:MAG: putative quinol monooxygenase [Bacteroidetes bacterium]|nr:putative quinol monooxygenase [Bacteroidota bacterium]MDA1119338.1 putative quinol monooxygenase [Bacteroidota bacterium]